MPRNLGPFPLWEPHLPAPTFGENYWGSWNKSNREERGLHITDLWKDCPWVTLTRVSASFLKKLNISHFKCLLPLPKAILLAPTWWLSTSAPIPLTWRITYCYYDKRPITMPGTHLSSPFRAVCCGSAGPLLTRDGWSTAQALLVGSAPGLPFTLLKHFAPSIMKMKSRMMSS